MNKYDVTFWNPNSPSVRRSATRTILAKGPTDAVCKTVGIKRIGNPLVPIGPSLYSHKTASGITYFEVKPTP